MADIPLRTYVQQLDNLIERKNVDEAIAHSRHILSFYPKHLDTYRMLGKALLEKGRHGDAADVFERVLSVLPDDFISHVGMAIVREDEANVDAALWHMERAYEAVPSNGAIQQELCRLYGRRDGVVPPKARLTRGALGRMYMQGGLYLQAEAELKAALTDDPERVDLQTILAQVYWYSEQPATAAQLCGLIVQSLPYSQVANRILREIFRARGRDADAALYRQRLEALDPYEALAAPGDEGTLSTADQVEAGKVLVTRLEYVAGMESQGGPDWIASIGARFEEPMTYAGDGTPDWLNAPPEAAAPLDMNDVPGAGDVPAWLAAAAEPATDGTANALGDLPNWLSDKSQAGAPASDSDDDLPDWLRGAASNSLANADVPDWMQTAARAGGTPPSLDATPGDEALPTWLPAAQGQPAPSDEASPPAEWMDTVVAAPTGEGAAPTLDTFQPNAASDLPDWITAAAPLSAQDDDLPDWLKASTGALPDTMLGSEATSEAALPWLAGAETEAPLPPALEAPTEVASAAPAEETPDWMQTFEASAPEAPILPDQPTLIVAAEQPAAALTPADDVPDWLAATSAAAADDDVPEWMQAAAPDVPASATPSVPATDEDVLASLAEVPAAGSAEEVPDWMQTPAAELVDQAQPEALEPPVEATLAAATPAEDMPEWLRNMAADASGAPVPAWLQDQAPAEAEAPTAQAALEALPDWLNAATAPSPGDEVPVWLQTTPAETADAPEPPGVAEMAGEAEAPAAAATPSDDTPAWLSEAQATPKADVPAWLPAEPESVASLEPEALASAEATLSTEISPLDDIPAWLRPGAVDLADAPDDEAPGPLALDAEAQAVEAQMPGGSAEAEPTSAADVPEWLRALSEDTEDNRTAHWEALADAEFGIEEPADLEEDEIEEPEQPLPEGIPDWLQTMASTAPPPDSQPQAVEPEAESEEAAPTSTPAIELPDFLQLASPEAIARAAEPFEMSEEAAASTEAVAAGDADDELAPGEMPDWLKALAPESTAASTSVPAFDADIMAAAAAGMSLDDAPDWMKAAQPGTATEAGLPTGTADLNLGDVPDWLQAAQPAMPADASADLNLDDAPDWLKEAAAFTPAESAAGDLTAPADAETVAWLQPAHAEEQPADLPAWAQAEAPGATDTIITFLASKDTPEKPQQLRELAGETESEPAGPELVSPEALADEPVELSTAPPDAAAPDAVTEFEATVPVEASPAPVMEAAAPVGVEPDTVPELSLDDMSPDDAMRWLESLAARQGAPAEELIMSAPASSSEAPAVPTEASAQTEPVSEIPATEAPDGLPDWLREVEASYEVDALADTAPHARIDAPAAAQPDWLAAEVAPQAEAEAEPEPEREPEMEAPSAARPEWLSELEALGDELEPTPAQVDAGPELAGLGADEALRWLEDQAALAEAKSVPVQGLAETEGLDDLGLDTSATAEAAVPDIEAMDADEAMAWLEKLAAQQGASADELLSAPEDRPEATPAWIVASQQAEAETEAERPALEPGLVPDWLAELEAAEDADEDRPLEPAILPDWLKPPSEAVPDVPAATGEAALAAGPEAPEPVMSSGPDFASMDAEAAMAWLESLAAQQGANPEELLTAPEERPAAAPAWVQAEESAAALAAAEQEAVMAAQEARPVEAAPPVMEAAPPVDAIVPEPALADQSSTEPELVEPVGEAGSPAAPDVSKLSRLSERLAAGRRAKEAEIEARFAQQRAEQEEARRLVWESMQAKKAAVEAAIESMEQPPASEPAPAAPEAQAPATVPVRPRTSPLTRPAPRRVTGALPAIPDESAWVPATPPRKPARVSRYAGQAPETVLAEAQAHLQQHDEAAAAAALDHLVSTGQMMNPVIEELESVAGPTASVPLLRVLGDAYARSNRLEQALETYREALRRL